LCTSSHNELSFLPRKAATLVIFVALTEDVAMTVKHAVIMQVPEDTTAAITHKLFVVLAEWTGYVVDVVLGKFA